MRPFTIVLLTLSLIFVISCAPALKQKEIDPWLNTISGGKPSEIDITGQWHDAEGSMLGWGKGYLSQE